MEDYMARSKLLMDVVNGDNKLESVLMRLKVILSSLQNDNINKWVDSELKGYDTENQDIIPSYRKFSGQIGTYLVNYQYKYSNSLVPLDHLDKEMQKSLEAVVIYDGIIAIQDLLDKEEVK